ncbi:hypothetical protein GF374_01155 [Candidatus Woesearchaeota archaeon]|nr:hypothetical protein [Candidatus Woesearchaeota archaeon]
MGININNPAVSLEQKLQKEDKNRFSQTKKKIKLSIDQLHLNKDKNHAYMQYGKALRVKTEIKHQLQEINHLRHDAKVMPENEAAKLIEKANKLEEKTKGLFDYFKLILFPKAKEELMYVLDCVEEIKNNDLLNKDGRIKMYEIENKIFEKLAKLTGNGNYTLLARGADIKKQEFLPESNLSGAVKTLENYIKKAVTSHERIKAEKVLAEINDFDMDDGSLDGTDTDPFEGRATMRERPQEYHDWIAPPPEKESRFSKFLKKIGLKYDPTKDPFVKYVILTDTHSHNLINYYVTPGAPEITEDDMMLKVAQSSAGMDMVDEIVSEKGRITTEDVSFFKGKGGTNIAVAYGNYLNLRIEYENKIPEEELKKNLAHGIQKIEKIKEKELLDGDLNLTKFAGVLEEYYAPSLQEFIREDIKRRKNKPKKIIGAAIGIPTIVSLSFGAAWPYILSALTPEPEYTEYEPEVHGIAGDLDYIEGTAGQPLDFQVVASDANGDALLYDAQFAKNGSKIKISEDGWIHIKELSEDWIGEHLLNISASDGKNTDYKELKLIVYPENQKPYINSFEVQKTEDVLKILDAHALDNDTGIKALKFYLDDNLIKEIYEGYFSGEIDLEKYDLTPGSHKIGVQAVDEKDDDLVSDLEEKMFSISGEPLIKNIDVTQKEDDVEINFDVGVEGGELEKVNFNYENISLEKKLSGKEDAVRFKFQTDGLEPVSQTGELAAHANGETTYKNITITPFDDAPEHEFRVESLGNDTFSWQYSVEDEEAQIVHTEVSLKNASAPLKQMNPPGTKKIELKGSIDFSEKAPGKYVLVANSHTSTNQSVRAEREFMVLNDPAMIYSWNISNGPSNTFNVDIEGLDKDTIPESILVTAKKENESVLKSKLVNISSKQINVDVGFNFTSEEPVDVYFDAELDNGKEKIPIFKNERREILNDASILENLEIFYNPVVDEFKISGGVQDPDSNFSSAQYLLKEKESGLLLQGELNAKDSEWNGTIEEFWANVSKSRVLPDGTYDFEATFKDKFGKELDIQSQVNVNSSYRLLTIEQDPSANNASASWDENQKVGHLKKLGSETLLEEKLNDFETLATPDVVNETKKNYTQYINYSSPFETAKAIHKNIIMNYSQGRDENHGLTGYEDDTQITIDFRTSMEWIKNQVLNNNSVSEQDKDLWRDFIITPIKYGTYFPTSLCKTENDEYYIFAQSDTPFQRSSVSNLVTDFESYKPHYGNNEAIKAVKETLIDWTDMEHRSGGKYSDIVEKIDFNLTTAEKIINCIDKLHVSSYPEKINKLTSDIYSAYDAGLLENKKLEIKYNQKSFEFDLYVIAEN